MPVEYIDQLETVNSNLLLNNFFMDALSHVDQERIPERVVHAKGSGAFGYFEVTHDITDICRAKLFDKVGKKTPLIARFSPTFIEKGASDATRETRGMALKFYTEDGNYDIVTLNVEMFAMKDPAKFPSFTHAFKRNPRTNLMDVNMNWDFITQNPESIFMFLRVFGDRGIPYSFRHMPAFSIHTFEFENVHKDKFFVKYHILPNAGERNLPSNVARRLAGEDPDFARRDLYEAIENGKFPSWTVSVQVMSLHDVKNAKFDPFDITRWWSLRDYPLRPVGKMVLNRNPDNFFATIEQVAYSPGNVVPGIRGIDKVFEARTFSYRDTHRHRLGSNPNKIEVNCPVGIRMQTKTYNHDGAPPVKDNEGDAPNYYPNSFNGPVAYIDEMRTQVVQVYTNPHVNNFDQAAELYAEMMTEGERRRLVANIVFSLRDAARFLQERALKLFKLIHPDFGHRVEYGLLVNSTTTA